MNRRIPILLLIVFAIALPVAAQDTDNCYSILVGRKASSDGAVLYAHNEDDPMPAIVNWHKVPRKRWPDGAVVTLKNGGTLPQVPETFAYVWLQMPEKDFSDTVMNEFGVTIASNACRSRVRDANLTDGGIGYWLRRLMAERAKTAREAVALAGRLVERFGYYGSGRTYCVSDPTEAWMMAVVHGKLWVAERVPDNQVAVIANRYTLTTIDLTDTDHFMGTRAVIDYAVSHGWYNPETDGPFNFEKVYNLPKSRYSIRNIARQWEGVRRLAAEPVNIRKPLPTVFKPKDKVSLVDLMSVLRDHYEGTQFESPAGWHNGDPHPHFIMRICSDTSMYGVVAHLRADLPAAVGCTLWVAPRHPCENPFVPVFCGITGFPDRFTRVPWEQAIATQFVPDPFRYEETADTAWWDILRRDRQVNAAGAKAILTARKHGLEVEQALLAAVPGFQKRAAATLATEPDKVARTLTAFTSLALGQLTEKGN